MSLQFLADPVEMNFCQDLARYREESSSFKVLHSLISLLVSDQVNNAPSPVGQNNLRVPNRKLQSV